MKRFGTIWGLAVLIGAISGCGSDTHPEAVPAPKPPVSPKPSADQTSSPVTETSQPAEIVSLFLDRIRRGGVQTETVRLLTIKAQEECRRKGLVMRPLGSPETHFEVTRTVRVPNTDDSAMVHCLLTEPNENGGKDQFEVVWALKKEPQGWRISGFATEIPGADEPMIVDFEDGADAATKLGSVDAEPQSSQR